MTPHAHARRYHRTHAALEAFNAAQAREYQALAEEATVMKVAGILVEAGNLDEFELTCRREGDSDNRIIRAALAMARRWQRHAIATHDAADALGPKSDRYRPSAPLSQSEHPPAPTAAGATRAVSAPQVRDGLCARLSISSRRGSAMQSVATRLRLLMVCSP